MKNLLTVLFSFMSITSYAQNDDLINKLILTTKEGLQKKKEVIFDNQATSLHIGEWIVPISRNTLVKVEFENGYYEVEFSLQKGTTIRSTSDPNWRRASFALSFNSQQAAKNFIHLFQEITERENVN
jgi:hypothetical protein